MIQYTDLSNLHRPFSDLPDSSPRPPDRKSEPHNKVSAQPDESCPRCAGLLVLDYTTPTEWYITGIPIRLRRCVNCGNCMDLDIMANRMKGPEPARPRTRRARPPTGIPLARQLQGSGTGRAG
jgi:hypothetical protein